MYNEADVSRYSTEDNIAIAELCTKRRWKEDPQNRFMVVLDDSKEDMTEEQMQIAGFWVPKWFPFNSGFRLKGGAANEAQARLVIQTAMGLPCTKRLVKCKSGYYFEYGTSHTSYVAEDLLSAALLYLKDYIQIRNAYLYVDVQDWREMINPFGVSRKVGLL